METRICPVYVVFLWRGGWRHPPVPFWNGNGNAGFTRVDISRVINCCQIQYVGIEAYVFLCEAWMEEKRQLLELRYTIRSHTWCLLRVVN